MNNRLQVWIRAAAFLTIVCLIAGIIGCDGKGGTGEKIGDLFAVPKARPANLDRTVLRLLHQSRALYVGDDQSHVYEVFGPPVGATDITELPNGWDKDHYRVKGWEKGKDSFGAMLLQDEVAFAMFTSEGRSTPDINALLQDYDDVLGQPSTTISQGHITYYFWSSKTQRLMISILNVPSEGNRITQALGARELMDALRMSESAAKEDAARASNMGAKETP